MKKIKAVSVFLGIFIMVSMLIAFGIRGSKAASSSSDTQAGTKSGPPAGGSAPVGGDYPVNETELKGVYTVDMMAPPNIPMKTLYLKKDAGGNLAGSMGSQFGYQNLTNLSFDGRVLNFDALWGTPGEELFHFVLTSYFNGSILLGVCYKDGGPETPTVAKEVQVEESAERARFRDMGDGTIQDNKTGLIWLKNANCAELPHTDSSGGTATWNDALSAAASLRSGICGLTDGSKANDWRLPTKEEWEAFMSADYINPALVNTRGGAQWSEGDPFSGVQPYAYWSSTWHSTKDAWFAYMAYGGMYTTGKHFIFYVWPVRRGN